MSNTVPVRGLDPEWHSSTPPLCAVTNLPTSAYSGSPLFINSAVVRVAGFLNAVAVGQTGSGTDETNKCTGSITMIYDAAGAPAHNYAANAGGRAEHTNSAGQRFRATVSGTGYVATETGTGYNLDAEGQSAGTAGALTSSSMGGHYSDRQLNNGSQAASSVIRMFTVVNVTPQIFGNDVAVLNTELWVITTPSLYQP